MQRRDFLKTSLAAGVTVAFLRAQASEQSSGGETLTAPMIWTAQPVPVPLKLDGPAAGIASSSDGSRPTGTPDLHAVFAREFNLDTLPARATIPFLTEPWYC